MDMNEGPGRAVRKAAGFLNRNRYILPAVLAGVILLCLPSGGGTEQEGAGLPLRSDPFQTEELEQKLEQVLSQVAGAGEVRAVLTVREGPMRIMAQDGSAREGEGGGRELSSDTVVISRGGGIEDAVTVQEIGPRYQGAVIVSPGADDPAVRLAISEAVSALTGLGADKISICRGR